MSKSVDKAGLRRAVLSALLGFAALSPALAFAEGGYVSAAVGQSDWDGLTKETGFALAFGAPVDSTWGYELGYVYHGKLSESGTADGSAFGLGIVSGTVSAQIHSFYAAGTARMPLAGNLAAHAKLGIAANYVRGEADTNVVSGSASETYAGAVAGLGLSYKFAPQISGIVDYTYFDRVAGSSTKAQSLHAGVRYHF